MPIHGMALEFVARVEVAVGASTTHTRVVRLLSVCAWRTTLVISVDDAKTILASPGDRIRCPDTLDTFCAVCVWLCAGTAGEATCSARSNHIITLLTLDPKLRVRRAGTIHASIAIHIRLLARGA